MGTWNLGTKKDITEFINKLNQLKDDYYNVVGDDQVFDGLDSAIERAKELKLIKEEFEN